MPTQRNVTTAIQARKLVQSLALTEAQIVRMDDAQYMIDAQKQFFRGRLTALQELLQARSR